MLEAENLSGSASIGDARIRWGDGRVMYEMPRRLVPETRDYLIRVTFDAVGGTPFRKLNALKSALSLMEHG